MNLSTGEVNSLVMVALRPIADAARDRYVPADGSPWGFGWSVGYGLDLTAPWVGGLPSGPIGVWAHGSDGFKLYLSPEVAREVAERVALDHPEELLRIRGEIAEHRAYGSRDYDGPDEELVDEAEEVAA